MKELDTIWTLCLGLVVSAVVLDGAAGHLNGAALPVLSRYRRHVAAATVVAGLGILLAILVPHSMLIPVALVLHGSWTCAAWVAAWREGCPDERRVRWWFTLPIALMFIRIPAGMVAIAGLYGAFLDSLLARGLAAFTEIPPWEPAFTVFALALLLETALDLATRSAAALEALSFMPEFEDPAYTRALISFFGCGIVSFVVAAIPVEGALAIEARGMVTLFLKSAAIVFLGRMWWIAKRERARLIRQNGTASGPQWIAAVLYCNSQDSSSRTAKHGVMGTSANYGRWVGWLYLLPESAMVVSLILLTIFTAYAQ